MIREAAAPDSPRAVSAAKAAAVDRVEIHWPSGKTQTLAAPKVNQRHRIIEP
jgi:hypothetical protein